MNKQKRKRCVLLSIKPKYANKIFEGTKKYEFRRTIFKDQSIKKIVVYASSPVQMIIGEFEIDSIITHDISTLWGKTKKHSGITKDFFLEYFVDKEHGFAIKIKRTRLYKTPKCIREHFNLAPPQSFIYLA